MTKVLVLGATGMLGSMVAEVLGDTPGIEVSATARHENAVVGHRRFDALGDRIGPLLDREDCEWIVNAVGITNARIDEHAAASVEHAIKVNALFPHRLVSEAAGRGQRVIHVSTDGVFSGASGPYDEGAAHDPRDVYGKTKSLGEVTAPNVLTLRCSLVGPEPSRSSSLLGWALSAEPGAHLSGYTRQRWNGITSLQFARICAALVAGAEIPSPQHIVPADTVTKAELLELAASAFGREDIIVRRDPGPEPVDRTLTTLNREANARLWSAAGYAHPPTIGEMLRDLAVHVTTRAGSAA